MPRTISDVAELCSPRGNLLQRFSRKPVIAVAARSAGCDQPTAPEHCQMFRKRRLSYVKRFAELKYGKLALLQPLKNASACWVGYCPKDPTQPITSHGKTKYISKWLYVNRNAESIQPIFSGFRKAEAKTTSHLGESAFVRTLGIFSPACHRSSLQWHYVTALFPDPYLTYLGRSPFAHGSYPAANASLAAVGG